MHEIGITDEAIRNRGVFRLDISVSKKENKNKFREQRNAGVLEDPEV